MSETLIGVIVGAAVALVGPVLNAFMERSRWKRQAKPEHLRLERARWLDAYSGAMQRMVADLGDNSYPARALAERLGSGR